MAHIADGLIDNPSRLFAAADVLLRAIESPHGFDSRIRMHIGALRVGETLPPNVFTAEELIEAMDMLIRMGLVLPDGPAACDPGERTAGR